MEIDSLLVKKLRESHETLSVPLCKIGRCSLCVLYFIVGFRYDALQGGQNNMDQIKIGEFLKELRKGKGITQEQLAEQFHVSRRSVSRWENGNNMPDITLLVELAEFYDISISEIIDGERKSEKMNKEVKETALKLSDYAETINQKIKLQLFWLTIIAFVGMIAFIVIDTLGLDKTNCIYEHIASVGLGLNLGMLTVIAMYLSGVLGKIKAKRAMQKNEGKCNL